LETEPTVPSDVPLNRAITQSENPALPTRRSSDLGPSPRTATITGTPAFGSAGTYSIVFTVNDGSGATNATASSTTVLTIGATNQAPSITAPATASGAEGSPAATITATATDPDASNNLTITQSGKPASLTFTTDSPGASPRTPTLHDALPICSAGTYSIVFTVNDGSGATNATASATTVLTITATNRQPAITA